MRHRTALLCLLALQVGVLALLRARPDLDAPVFILTYWFPIMAALLLIYILWNPDD